MTPVTHDLDVWAGTPFAKTFRYLQSTPDPDTGVRPPVDMTGWTARVQVRTRPKAVEAVLDSTPPIDTATGAITLTWTGEQTALLTATGYVWALELYGPQGDSQGEIVAGRVRVAPEVVR